MLIPNLKRTWAPTGKTPLHYHSYKRVKVNTIGALAVSPKYRNMTLYLKYHKKSVTGVEIRSFLANLLMHLQGNIMLLWDRAPIHRRKLVNDFIQKHSRLIVEEFPSYAPELNPAEFIWNRADEQLSNTSPEDLKQLKALLYKSAHKLSNSQKLLWSCIFASDLPWK